MLFWALAALLAAAATGLLVWPLVRSAPPARLDRRSAALAAHRARLAELEGGAEDPAGDPGTGREARDDIARALLRDLDAEEAPGGEPSDARRTRPRRGAAVALGAALPAIAVALYAWLGEPDALRLPARPSEVRTAAAIGAEVGRLLGEAESLARVNGNRLDGEPARLIDQALILAPEHRRALWFAAIAALHEDRAADARDRLERLRGLGPLDETESQMFDQLMAEAVSRLAGG